MYYLPELLPADFTPEAGGGPQNAGRWRVVSRCRAHARASAEALAWAMALSPADRKRALKGLLYLVKIAQTGLPLSGMLDEKRLHETHEFHCPASGKREKVWRYRDGDIRVLFYYGRDRLVLLTNVVPKRTDRLSRAELNQAEKAVNEYLLATQGNAIEWLS